MKKGQTLLIGTDGKKRIGDGELVFSFQVNRIKKAIDEYQLSTNLDWSFDDETTVTEIKSAIGSFLSTIEDIFGEKMVTEAIMHYAEERDHLVITPQGAGLKFRSKGLKFKNWK